MLPEHLSPFPVRLQVLRGCHACLHTPGGSGHRVWGCEQDLGSGCAIRVAVEVGSATIRSFSLATTLGVLCLLFSFTGTGGCFTTANLFSFTAAGFCLVILSAIKLFSAFVSGSETFAFALSFFRKYCC